MKQFTERYYSLIWVKKYGEVTETQKPEILRMLEKELDEKIEVKKMLQKREYSIDYIQNKVCKYFNITREELHNKTRKTKIVQARQIAAYFSKKLTNLSWTEISWQIGKKDHATAIWGVKTINNLIETDKKFAVQVKEIERKIKLNHRLL